MDITNLELLTQEELAVVNDHYGNQLHETIMVIVREPNGHFKDVYTLPITDEDNVEIVGIASGSDGENKVYIYLISRNTYNKHVADEIIDFYQNVLKVNDNPNPVKQSLVKLLLTRLGEKGE